MILIMNIFEIILLSKIINVVLYLLFKELFFKILRWVYIDDLMIEII